MVDIRQLNPGDLVKSSDESIWLRLIIHRNNESISFIRVHSITGVTEYRIVHFKQISSDTSFLYRKLN